VFSGGNTSLDIEVEGYTAREDTDRGSSTDAVGPGYFSTLGIPILVGREILESDHAGAPKVCVVNEAFVRRFFQGRNPIGMQITSKEDDTRSSCQIVGVARDARTENLRSAVRTRYFVSAAQAPFKTDGYFFLVRTVSENASIPTTMRETVQHVDAALSLVSPQTIEDRLAPLTAQDRITTQLVSIFGGAAMALAAIGLYGVLSYSVGRRKREIAIRIALGAQPSGVITLLLRETMRVVAIGLVFGLGLAYLASRLIQNQLYGVALEDPLTLASAVGVLIVVALMSAYLPAYNASKLDPITTLRSE
jgi:predicted permease